MTSKYNLAILSTHPIQYHAPWFRGMAAHPDLDVHVYFCHKATPQEQARAGFGVEFDWDVDLLAGYPHSFLKNIANPAGHGRFGGFDTPEIGKIIRERRYDALLVNGWNYKSAWQAVWAAWKSGVKVMVRGDSHLLTERTVAQRAVKWLVYRRFIPRFDACLAVGQWSREYFLHYGARPERIFSVPHVVDFDVTGSDAVKVRRRFRQAAGLNADAVTFMFCGKFVTKKRPMDFVTAVSKAAERGAAIQGLMVGDGPLRDACEQFVASTRGPIRFAGFLNRSKISEAYLACDVLVLPSDARETWGLVVNEAMSCGRACIVRDHVGCGPDMVRPGATGMIYPLGDVEILVAVMKDLASDAARLSDMGRMARLTAQNYKVSNAVEGVLQALRATVGAREAVCLQ
ncbi:MAG TPA: glycosyltransferase family 4 protein [Candidatus Sulfotelmatobacter sp.]